MKSYKGFDKDLKCRDFQYEIGKEYKEDKAQVCNCGFHSCLNPMDVFNYYPPTDDNGNLNRFCEVEIPKKMDKSVDDSKVATKKIKIEAEIGLKGLIEAGVKFIFSKVDFENNKTSNDEDYSAATNTGYWSAATNTGYWSAATNTGYRSAATNTGDYSAATNTGDYSAATNTGNYSAATNTGDQSAATNTGYRSAATNTGNYSVATNTGDWSAATNTGYYSAATVTGKDSVAIATGYEGRAKGALGCYIVLAERNMEYKLVDVKAAKVDGEIIKANTYYKLVNGEFVEVEEK